MNHELISTNSNESMFQCSGNILPYLVPINSKLCHQQRRLCLHCFGSLKDVHQFPEEKWKSECWIILWSLGDSLRCSSKETSRPGAVNQFPEERLKCECCEVLVMLYGAVRRKYPGLVIGGVLLQHGNASWYTAWWTQEKTGQLELELLEHPHYSPDLTPSEFHLFGALPTHLGGKFSLNDKEVASEVKMCQRQCFKDIYCSF